MAEARDILRELVALVKDGNVPYSNDAERYETWSVQIDAALARARAFLAASQEAQEAAPAGTELADYAKEIGIEWLSLASLIDSHRWLRAEQRKSRAERDAELDAMRQRIEASPDRRQQWLADVREMCAEVTAQFRELADLAAPSAPTAQMEAAQANYAERCRIAQECLPDAEYRRMLTALHADMLAAISAEGAGHE